jgi:glycosyltransferase involved in cell wall biosynthesis
MTVDIIVPVYNSEKYLGQCIESVRNQTYQDWKCIFVYSPSSDASLQMIASIVQSDPRFSVHIELSKSNCATARNIGFSDTRGEYVALLDSDDWWYPTKLEEMVNVMGVDQTLDWCTSWVDASLPDGTIETFKIYPAKTLGVAGTAYSMFRRTYLEKIRREWGYIFYEKLDRDDDMDLAMRVRHANSVMIPKSLSFIRYVQEGLTWSIPAHVHTRMFIDMALRNHAWDFLPRFVMNHTLGIINRMVGCDIVAIKKRMIG